MWRPSSLVYLGTELGTNKVENYACLGKNAKRWNISLSPFCRNDCLRLGEGGGDDIMNTDYFAKETRGQEPQSDWERLKL